MKTPLGALPQIFSIWETGFRMAGEWMQVVELKQ
jgi:hypothetical protein